MNRKPLIASLLAAGLLLASLPSALAQYAGGLVSPGQPLSAAMLSERGGPVGRQIAPVVNVRPIFITYWRPGDPLSERALAEAVQIASRVAPEAALVPVAFLAAGQSPGIVDERLAALGISGVRSYQDNGQLARLLGVRGVPSFALVDAGGVLRLVGGSSVTQSGEGGVSIAEALALAGRAESVPTLGALPVKPIYRMLGRNVGDLALSTASGESGTLSELAGGKRALIFYWLPNCGHCKRALPELRRWYESTKPQDLVVFDIVQAQSQGAIQQAQGIVAGYPFTHVVDSTRSAGRTLMVSETPTTFLVSEEGEILSVKVGANVDWERWLGGS